MMLASHAVLAQQTVLLAALLRRTASTRSTQISASIAALATLPALLVLLKRRKFTYIRKREKARKSRLFFFMQKKDSRIGAAVKIECGLFVDTLREGKSGWGGDSIALIGERFDACQADIVVLVGGCSCKMDGVILHLDGLVIGCAAGKISDASIHTRSHFESVFFDHYVLHTGVPGGTAVIENDHCGYIVTGRNVLGDLGGMDAVIVCGSCNKFVSGDRHTIYAIVADRGIDAIVEYIICDEKIADVCLLFGARAGMVTDGHPRCTKQIAFSKITTGNGHVF